MKIKCWVIWWKGKRASVCDAEGQLMVFRTKKEAASQCLDWITVAADDRYEVRRATLEVEE